MQQCLPAWDVMVLVFTRTLQHPRFHAKDQKIKKEKRKSARKTMISCSVVKKKSPGCDLED